MTGSTKVWRAPLAGLASVAMIATMGVAASTANAAGENNPTYTVTFDLNGRGSLDDANKTQKITAGDSVKFEAAKTTPSAPAGWTFTGWYTADGVKFNPETPVTADATLYAHWGKDVKTVRFQNSPYLKFADTNQDGNEDAADRTITLAAGDTVADWEKPTDASATDGRILTGFTTADKKDWDSSVAPTGKTTQIKAKLEKSQYVEYTNGIGAGALTGFTVSGGNDPVEFVEGEDVPETPTASYEDGTLKLVSKWAYNPADPSAGTGRTEEWLGGPIPETADGKTVGHLSLAPVADESDPEAVKVTFDVTGGPTTQDFAGKPYFVAKGDSAPEVTVNTFGDAYEFNGWYTDASLTQRYYGDVLDADTDFHGELVLKNVTYNVTFDPDYDGSTPVVTKVARDAAAEWQTATRDGYVFQGWSETGSNSLSDYVTNADDFADSYGKITAPVYLKAAWLTTAQDEMKNLLALNTGAYTTDSRKEYAKTAEGVAKDASVAYSVNSNKTQVELTNGFLDFRHLGEKAVAEWVKTLKAAQLKLVTKDQTFTDVFDGSYGAGVATPHSDEIEFVAKKGISTGYGDGTFKPTGSMFRQDYAAFLYRLAGSPEYTPAASDNIFTDVTPATPHYKEILWAAKQGIIKGFADGTFRGLALVNRQDAAAFLYRLAGSPEYDPSTAAKTFTDVNESTPHYKEVLWAANTVVNYDYDGVKGSTAIINGFQTGTFDGYATLLRQDGAAFLARTYFYINK